MDRKQKALRWVDKNGRGVEIGPSHCPLAPKAEGFNVHIIDHIDREELIAKYKRENIDTERIEEVDFIWKGESFADLTGKRNYYDWVIASHVVEHTPDLAGFLNNCDALLKEDGVLSLVVPDKRYIFDFYRPITGLARIVDAHVQQRKTHTPGTAVEFTFNFTKLDGLGSWEAGHPKGAMQLQYRLVDVEHRLKIALEDQVYHDFHAWCFTPSSFRLLVHDLNLLGYIKLKEVDFFPTTGNEFYVTLSRSGKGIGCTRLELLDGIDRELAEAARSRWRAPGFIRSGRSLLGRGLRRAMRLFSQRSAA